MKQAIVKLLSKFINLLFNKSNKDFIFKILFKIFKVNPILFAYNNIGIYKHENEFVSGEIYLINDVLPRLLGDKELIIFDIGANVGNYAKRLLTKFPDSFMHLFEPSVESADKLKEKYLQNTNVKINNIALGSEIKDVLIYTNSNNLMSEHTSLYSSVFTDIHDVNEVSTYSVAMGTLDEYCKNNSINKIDFLKIDTEGSEYDILIGARQLIENNSIKIVQFEFNEMNVVSRIFFKDFFDLLSSSFFIYRLDSNRLIHIKKYDTFLEVFKFQNFVAINRSINV